MTSGASGPRRSSPSSRGCRQPRERSSSSAASTSRTSRARLRDVIGAYRKQLQKALAEYEKLGERGAAQAAQLRFEIEFCERFLPRGLDVTALRSLVQERARSLGITDPKQIGRLVGDVMKT